MSKQAWEFRDPHTPARIAILLRDKAIDRSDLLLLWIIGALVKPHDESAGEAGKGCWAPNEYLAKAAGIHEINVSHHIHKLKKKSLLIVFNSGGRRYIELEWSRTAEERASMTGSYGRDYRKAYDEQITSGLAESLNGVSGIANGSLSEIANHNDKVEVKERGGDRVAAPSPIKSEDDVRRLVWVDRLRRILRKKTTPVPVSTMQRSNQAECFRKLEKKGVSPTRIDRLLDWYEDNINSLSRPTITGAEQFCNGCFTWLEDKMNEDCGPPEEDHRDIEEKWEETLPDGSKVRYTRIKR